jgi:hypothetical protein
MYIRHRKHLNQSIVQWELTVAKLALTFVKKVQGVPPATSESVTTGSISLHPSTYTDRGSMNYEEKK